jgi:hypothetical protein
MHQPREVKAAQQEFTASIVSWRRRTDPATRKGFTEYSITVKSASLQWTVHKRYSEFRTLAAALRKAKVNKKKQFEELPSLPGVKLFGNMKAEFIEQRLTQLNTYFQACLLLPNVTSNIQFLEFMGVMRDHTKKQKTSITNIHTLHVDRALSVVKTGDIVLFRTDALISGLQRAVLSATYDHVGIVVRIPYNSKAVFSLFLLEATADGVLRYPFRARTRAWHLSNAQLVLRQLSTELTVAQKRQLTAFVASVEGLPYGLSPAKLLRRHSEAPQPTTPSITATEAKQIQTRKRQDTKVTQEDTAHTQIVHKNYFCSELVASCYKAMDLLPESPSASTYFPVNFSAASSKLRMQHATLGKEIKLEFHALSVGKSQVYRHASTDQQSKPPGRSALKRHSAAKMEPLFRQD